MVQYIRPGKSQQSDPPKKTQPSLFGNGQDRKFGGMHNTANGTARNTKAEEERAKAKFAQTSAGKSAMATIKQDFRDDEFGPGDTYYTSKSSAPKQTYAPPCHHSHPPYPVADGLVIYGGSGIKPHVTDCDVYVSFDASRYPGRKSWPWEKGQDFIFEIKNYGVPDDALAFRQLVLWLGEQLKAGLKVHIGCMAGHGRTGMVLAALRMALTGDKDAIMHVRNNYCDQAVETDGQIKWLMKNWGMNQAPPRVKRYAGQDPKAKPATFGFTAEPLIDMNPSVITRDAKQNSWAANSPWYTPVEGPVADLGDTPWYADGEGAQ